MKQRAAFFVTLGLASIVCITTAVASIPASLVPGGAGSGYGAVKTGLFERMEGDPPNGPGSGDLSGFAIINVDPCDELLMTNTVLAAGEPNTMYDVYVKVNGAVNLVGTLTTNRVGRGTAQFYLDASAYAGPEGPGEIDVQIVVKPEGASEIIGYATDTVVETFPDCDCDDDDDDDDEPMTTR